MQGIASPLPNLSIPRSPRGMMSMVSRWTILCSPIVELLPRWRKLSQLVSHHLFIHQNLMILLAIVDHKFEADKVWNDGTCSRTGVYWCVIL
jgi:hypothetical protein